MAIEGLTQQQSDFIERFLKVPRLRHRKERKRQRREAVEQFRLFNAEHDMVREDILKLENPEIKSALLSRLAAAERTIEADPQALDFEGGHAHLADMDRTVQGYLLRQETGKQFTALQDRMDTLGKNHPQLASATSDAQSDIGLTWLYIEEKYEAGMAMSSARELEDAGRAMSRLDAMLDVAEAVAENPFDDGTGGFGAAKAAAREGLSDEAQAARRRLSDTHNQLSALREKLESQFGADGVPMALRMGLTATQKKLDTAADAAPAALPGLADDAGEALDEVQRAGRDMLAEAQRWAQDHEAFLVRYRVMQAHPKAGDQQFVKPEFDKITAAYDIARAKAAKHEYVEASQDITVVRHDLKDALDFADDCATFDALHAERSLLLDTLPALTQYKVAKLKDDDAEARKLLTDAVDLRADGQMTSALTLLNRIPGAVADILDDQKFALQHATYDGRCKRYLDRLGADYSEDVRTLIAADVAYAVKGREAAAEDAARGAYRSAAGQAISVRGFLIGLEKTAKHLKDYVTEREGLATRLAEAKARKGPEGRIAIESYYQALKENEAKRASAEASGDYKMAMAMCLRLKDDHAGMMARADDAKVYLHEKTLFDAEFAKLSELREGIADAAKATAMLMLANAVDASTRGNWIGGASLLRNAVLEMKRAVSDAKTAAVIDGLQEGAPKLTQPDTDFDSAFAAFSKVMEHVNAMDDEARFMDPLINAELKARGAEDEIETNPAKAQQTLEEAIDDCREIARKLTAAASYTAQLDATEALIGQAETANENGMIDKDIATAKETRDKAKVAADEPVLDFEAAIRLFGEAQAQARAGMDAMALHASTIKNAREVMARGLALLREPEVEPYLQQHAGRLQEVLDAMNTAFDARKFSEATSRAAEGIEMEASLVSVRDACKEAIDYKTGSMDGKFFSSTMNHAANVADAAEINRLRQVMETALQNGQFATALHTGKTAKSLYFAARRKARAIDAFLPVQAAAREKLEEIEPRAVAEAGKVHDDVAALRSRFDAAADQAEKGNYDGATKKLAGFTEACATAVEALDLYDRCALLRKRAEAALAEVSRIRVPAIDPLFARLEGKNANAERKMAAFDFETAAALYGELKQECDDARETIVRIETLNQTVTTLKEAGDGDAEALLEAIARAQVLLEDQKKDPSAMYAHAEIRSAEAQLKSAAAAAREDQSAARIDFEAAVDASAGIAVLMAQYDQLNRSAIVARDLATALRDAHPLRQLAEHKEYAIADIAARMAALEVAMTAARASPANRSQTQTDIEETIAALRDLKDVLDAHLRYAKARAPVAQAHGTLEQDGERHVIRAELTKARRHLDTAATRATERDHGTAMTEVKAAALEIEQAKLRIKLVTNTPPTPQDVQAILASEGGIDRLDAIVEALPPSVQREVMAVAFQARFGCALEMTKPGATREAPGVPEDRMDLPAPNLRRFYAEMSKLPESDTLDNDSMLIFLHQSGDQAGSAYNRGSKKVLMREGDESRSHIYAIAVEHEMGKPHEKAVPKEGQERTAFSWNTLHEVGHAVDDKLGFMKKHGERLAGWKVYGADVAEPAAEIAGKYDFDADYVREYMLSAEGRNLPVPDPVGCDPETWRRRMQECRMFVDRCRAGNQPWSSASVAAACVVGRYTYVESYNKNWARYLTDQRQYGISGYQFRAPGEWFSELYAAYHSGRMNDSHPHKDEIAGL